LTLEAVLSARREGRSVKLLATAAPGRHGGRWSLDVRPSLIDASHPLVHVNGTEKGITFLTDSMGSVTVTGGRSNPRGAAAALLKDIINIYRPPF
jgi:homoserine dehydrogenase